MEYIVNCIILLGSWIYIINLFGDIVESSLIDKLICPLIMFYTFKRIKNKPSRKNPTHIDWNLPHSSQLKADTFVNNVFRAKFKCFKDCMVQQNPNLGTWKNPPANQPKHRFLQANKLHSRSQFKCRFSFHVTLATTTWRSIDRPWRRPIISEPL